MKTFIKKLSKAFYGFALLCLFNSNAKAQAGAVLNFDGVDDYVEAPNVPFGNNWTVESWVNPATVGGGWWTPIGQDYWFAGQGFAIAIYNGTVFATTPPPYDCYIEAPINANAWTHLAFSYNNGIFAFYTNGILAGLDTAGFANAPGTLIIGGRHLNNNVGLVNSFAGSIDEVRVWNTTRTQCEIQQFMNCEILTSASGLVANYHFNQGTANGNNSAITSIIDASTNNRHGTFTGTWGLNSTVSNFTTPGPFTSGFSVSAPASLSEINITGNGVTIADGSSVPNTGNFTNFGTAYTRTFVIQNTGPAVLNTNKPVFTGAAAGHFTVSQAPATNIALVTGSTNLGISFLPRSLGVKTATVNLYSLDCSEPNYDFVITATAVAGGALNFDGVDDYVETNANLAELGKGDFTMEAWIKTTGVNCGIITYSDNDNTWEVGEKCFYIDGAGQPAFVGWGNNYINSTLAVNNGAWHHVAVTWNYYGNGTSGVGKIYIDGVDRTGGVSYAGTNTNMGGTFKIGRANFFAGEGTNHFIGEMDEVRIYDRALCLPEILNNMNCEIPSPASYRDLNGYYKFNSGIAYGVNPTGTVVTDNATFGNNGVLTNFALSGTISNWAPPAPVTTGSNCPVYAYNEVNVLGNGNDILINNITPTVTNHTDFGNVTPGTVMTRTFTIQNAGTLPLNITGQSLSGLGAASFTLVNVLPASLAANSSTILVVSFSSTTLGAKNAMVTITNDDCDEGTYNFPITASVVPFGEALSLDGLNDYVQLADPVFGTSDCTIECWFKTNLTGGGHLITTRSSQAFGTGSWWTIGTSGGTIGWELASAGSAPYTTISSPGGTIPLNTWTHLAAVRSGSQLSLYVNGVLVATSTQSLTHNWNTGTGIMRFGGWPDYNASWLNGSIDEVRLWTVARTQHEIQSYMNCEIAGAMPNLVGNYHFTQGAANLPNPGVTTLIDASASARNGTVYNLAFTGTVSNWTSPGAVNTGSTTTNPPTANIEVRGNGNVIADGTTVRQVSDFTNFNGAMTRTFVVHNTASGTLNFATYLTGANANQFSVTTIPASTVGASSSLGFVVTFTPTSLGTKTAVVNVMSNDLNEPLYDFVIEASSPTASALNFDGVDDQVVNIPNVVLNNQSFTIEFWAKRAVNSGNDLIVSQGIGNPNVGLHTGFLGTNFAFAFWANDLLVPFTDLNWHHWACVYKAGAPGVDRFIYRDGQLVASDNSASNYLGTGTVAIGSWSGGDFFGGTLDEVRIWNVARSQCEIQNYMNCEIPSTSPNLLVNFHFNQGIPAGTNAAYTIATDDAGGNNGTLTSFALAGATSNWIDPGAVVSGYSLASTPTLVVKGNSTIIPNNSMAPNTSNFTDFAAATTRTFVIENTGTGTLYINGGVFSGANASNFSITTLPSTVIAASGSSSFVISFTPTAPGTQSAIISLNSSDCNTPSYSFALTASTTPAAALTFDGTNDNVRIAYVQPLTNITNEFWFKTTNPNQGLFSVTDNPASITAWDRNIFITGGNVRAYVWAGGPSETITSTGTNFADGNWHHVAHVVSAPGQKLYVDGVLRATGTFSASTFNTNTHILLGYAVFNSSYLNGSMDAVRCWTVARSQCEILSYMNCEIPGATPGLALNYNFNQGLPSGNNSAVTTLTNATGGPNGTLMNFLLTSGSTSNWTSPGGVISGSVTPAVLTPTLNVRGNGVTIANNSTSPNSGNFTDFGTATTRTFVLENISSGSLYINGITFSGANASNFSVTTAPSTVITGVGSTNFVISFTPTAVGSQSAFVSVNSSDCTSPNYSFVITASTTPAEALAFSGVAEYVALPIMNPGADKLTFETWVKPTNITTNQYYHIMRQDASISVPLWLVAFQNYGTQLSFGVNTSSGYDELDATINPSYFTDGLWHHIAAVYDGSKRRIYVDGVQIAVGTKTGNIATGGTQHSLGRAPYYGEFYSGRMDEARYWNVARTQCEIQSYMSCEIPGSMPGLIANYHFNQGVPSGVNTTVTALQDAAGANTGTLTTFVLTGSVSNWVVPGAVPSNYTVAVAPTATLTLAGNGNNIPQGSSTSTNNFTDFGTATSRTFVITNPGAGPLYVNGGTFSGANAANFSITTAPSTLVAGSNGTSNFVITFTPTAVGSQSAVVTLNTSDCSSPNYSFVITASTAPASALSFDGSNDDVIIPYNATFDFPTGTVEAWININSAGSNGCIASMRNSSTTRWSIHANVSLGNITMYNGTTVGSINVPLSTNTWYHVAVVMTPTNMIVYLNGVYAGKASVGLNMGNTGHSLNIGTTNDAASTFEHFNGKMDEVRFWNVARTQCEIQTYMNCEIPTTAPGLFANYHFNQGVPSGSNPTVTVLTDATGSYNGTLNSFALNGSSSNWIVPGAVANGYTVPVAPTGTLLVSGNGNNIPQGSSTSTNNFTDFGTATSQTFVITNPGAGPLYVNGGTFSGANAANFSITTAPSTLVAGSNGTSNFVITFTPTAVGSQSAVVTLNSSDCTSPNYSFVITASTSPASALNFDGANDQVTVSGINLSNQPFTIEFWAKRNSSTTADMVLSHGVSSTNNGLLIGFRSSGNNVHFSYWANDFDIPGAVDLNWHHWAFVLDPSSGVYERRIFKDGLLIGTNNAGTPYTGAGNTIIGNTSWTPLVDPFHGSLDELRIWNTARTQCEIESYMNCEIPGTAASLVANYHFNQGIPSESNTAITTLTNAAGGSNGTLTNFALTGSVSNWVSPGGVISGYTTPAPPTSSLQVSGNSNSITPGATLTSTLNFTDFGPASTRTFVIQNTAAGTLNIAVPSLTGVHASEFSVTIAPSLSLAASATTSFVVAFTPTAGGARTATLSIYSNDCSLPLFSCAISGQAPPAEALSFNGASANTATRTLLSNLTSSVTMQTKVYWYGNTATTQVIFHNGNTSSSGYGIYNSMGGVLHALYGGVAFTPFNYTLTPNVWTDLAIVLRNGSLECYVNGVLTNVASVVNPNVPSTGLNAMFVVGSNQINTEHFNGKVDEIRFWDKALTQCEILTYKDCEIPGAMPNLLANYHFNQGANGLSNLSVTTATDASGNGNDLTLSNFALTGTLSNWVSPGGVASGYTLTSQPTSSLSVTGNGNTVAYGSTVPNTGNFTDFGTNTSRTFVLNNSPAGTLYINKVTFSGANAAQFSVSAVPAASLSGSGNTNLTIAYTPTAPGTGSAIVHVGSSDCTYPTYSFVITASTSPASALNFDGTNDRVLAANGFSLDNRSFTVEFWAKRNGASSSYVVGLGNSISTNDALHIGFRATPSPSVFTFAFYGNDINYGTPAATDGNYHHWACVYDNTVTSGSNRFLYLDGELVASDRSAPLSATGPLVIGDAGYYSGFPNPFNGSVDELRIWDTPRTQCEIQTYMNCEIPGSAANLVGNFHFNQGIPSGSNTAVTTLINDIGSNHGTLTGFSLTGSTSNFIAPAQLANGFTTTSTPNVTVSLSGNGNPILDNSTAANTSTLNHTDFGSTMTRTFVIQNSGTHVMSSVNLLITGPDASVFSVTTLPAATVGLNGSTSFVVAFTPTMLGAHAATINIGTNDCFNPFFSFAVTATVTSASALDFDGVNDYVEVANNSALNNIMTGNFSFEAWVKPASGQMNTILSKGHGGGPPGSGEYIFQLTPSNNLALFHTSLNNWKYGSGTLPLNAWSHVAVTFDGTHVKFYINGLLDATVPSSVGINTPGNNSLYIGSQGYSCLCNRFQGTIDEVRIWSVPRTQCEIITYMNCEIPGTPSGLLANYHFNSGIPSGSNASFSIAADGTGVNTGTLVNMQLSGPTSNWVSPGAVISGSTTPAVPGATLTVTGNNNTIAAGSMNPQLSNFTDFGTAATRTFVLQNTGSGTLHIGNGLFTGANASNFYISAIPSATLLGPSATTSIVISFSPTSVNTHSAVFTIYSSDCTSPEYSFAITASVVPAEALNFNGTSSYVDLGTSNALKPTAALSAEAWVYSSNWPSQDQTIFGNTETAGYGLFTRTTGNLEGLVRRNSAWGAVTTPLSGISPGWHHVAMTYDGRYTRLYLDGVMKSEDDAGANYTVDYINNNTLIGGEASSGSSPIPGWFFNGSVDELRVWNTARTQCEILTYKDCEIPGTPVGLIANYHFNQGIPSGSNTAVTTLTDAIGALNGTLNSFNLSGGSVANWISPGGVISNYTTTSVPAASISISGNGNPVLHGSTSTSTTNFTYFDTNPSRTFVIHNSPSGTLYINNISFSGANGPQFSVTTAPSSSLAGNGTSNFTILFTPTAVGISSAVVHVNSSDCSTPGFSFVITASTTAASALNFDGVDDMVAISYTQALTNITNEFWFKTTQATGDLFSVVNASVNPVAFDRDIYLNSGNVTAYLWLGATSEVIASSGTNYADGNWHHVAHVIGTGGQKLYVDGILKASGTATASGNTSGYYVALGYGPGSANHYINGSIDEVRLWNTTRTQCEIQTYMNAEIPNTPPGLAANYHFNQGIPSGPNMAVLTLTDAIGANHGLLGGFSLTGGPVSNWVSPGAVVSGFTTAVAPAVSMSVSGNSNPIAHGSTATSTNNFTDFGSVATRTFMIQNTGAAPLYVNTVTISGPDATSFSVTSAPSASVGTGSIPFMVSFFPASLGTKTAIVSINSSDCAAPEYSFVITATAVPASAMAFDGTDDYIDLGTSSLLKPTSALTEEAWVYLPNWVGSAVTFVGTAQTAGYTLRTNGTELRGFVYVNGGFLVAGTPLSTITPGWHHTAFTYDGRYANLYLDGVLMDTRDAGATYPITYTGNNMILGAEAGPGATPVGGYMGGRLDEVRIWNRALCQAEIQNSMHCQVGTTGNGLVANYHFNEGIAFGSNPTATVVSDASGNTLNGTVVNAQLSGTVSNWVNPGAVISGSVCGPFVAPEVSISSGVIVIPDGSSAPTPTNNTDFGNISLSANIVRTYTIQNSGIANLGISSITLTGANAASFSVSALSPASPVAPGNSAVFTVTFTPSTAGTKSAVVTVNNSDCDESAYDFVIQGTCTAGESFVFDGTNDYITCGNILTASYTKEAWVKIQASANGNNFVCAGTGVSGSALWAPGLYNYSLSAGHDGVWNQVQDNTPLSFGTWYHVAVTYDAPTKTMHLYKNGVLVSSNTNVPPFTGTSPLHIGAFAGGFVMNGSMDEVRIWNRALCPAEITNNMNCEIAANASGLIANYHFNQGVGYGANATNSTVIDASSSAATGTLMNVALSGTVSNWQTGGAVTTGSSCPVITVSEIDLLGNNVSITDGSTLALTSNHTDFGGVCSNTIMVRTYTVHNSGTASLNVSNITMSGANAAQFLPGTLSPASPVPPGGNAVFSVTFAPSSAGVKSATLNITNDDCSEGTYDVVLTATANALPIVGITVSNSVICEGNSTTLNGTGATTYTWTGGSPTVTNGVAFTPTITQTYTVFGTEALTGCTSTNTAVQTITVNVTPTITASSSSLVFCNGNSATITANGAGTYTLNPGIQSFSGNTISVSPNLTTSYSVVGTSTNNCPGINTVVITITVNALPTVTASSSNSLICNTATTSLIGSGASTYTWTGSVGAPTVTNGAPFSPTTTLTYTLSGTDVLTGCTSTNVAVQTISVNPTPTVNATAINSVICAGGSATLTASGADTYTWNPGALTGATITPMTATLTTYTVTGTSLAGCTSTNLAVQTISVNSLPTVTAAISQSVICAGNTITVNGSGADTYTWTGGVTDGAAFVPAGSNTFAVAGSSTLTGCTSTNVATVSVTVNALPSLSVTVSNSVICIGVQSSLSGSGASTYTWSSGVSDNVPFSPTITATYTLTATDLNSCTNTAVATITVNNLPTLTVIATPTLSCEAESTTLTVSGASSYTWNTGETSSTLAITPTITTSYTIMALDANSCTNTVNYTHSVTPCPGTFTASATVTDISCRGKNDGVIKVHAQTSYTNAQISYHWNPATVCPGNNCDSLVNLKPGIYGVTVKITYTLNGALVKTDTMALADMNLPDAAQDCELKIYNGVTANGDGINDVFTIENIEKFPGNKVSIFNRWGQLVGDISGYNNKDKAWPLQGEANNLTTHTYFYMIDLGNGTPVIKGWVELIKE